MAAWFAAIWIRLSTIASGGTFGYFSLKYSELTSFTYWLSENASSFTNQSPPCRSSSERLPTNSCMRTTSRCTKFFSSCSPGLVDPVSSTSFDASAATHSVSSIYFDASASAGSSSAGFVAFACSEASADSVSVTALAAAPSSPVFRELKPAPRKSHHL